MIVQKVLNSVIAVAMLAAAAVVAVVAAAFAFYALLCDYLHPAGAAAIVAGTAALGLTAGALALMRKGQPKKSDTEDGMATRLIDMARERPLVAAAAAIAVSVIAFRNPKVVAALFTGMMARRASTKN